MKIQIALFMFLYRTAAYSAWIPFPHMIISVKAPEESNTNALEKQK